MRRDFSAGAVVVEDRDGSWQVALIRPAGRSNVWALPKGTVEPGEATAAAAVREVREETGLDAEPITKLGDVRYVYSWDGQRISKVVSIYLMRAVAGTLGDLDVAHAHEVASTRWVDLDEAPRTLTYPGEREMAERARAFLAAAGPARGTPGGAEPAPGL